MYVVGQLIMVRYVAWVILTITAGLIGLAGFLAQPRTASADGPIGLDTLQDATSFESPSLGNDPVSTLTDQVTDSQQPVTTAPEPPAPILTPPEDLTTNVIPQQQVQPPALEPTIMEAPKPVQDFVDSPQGAVEEVLSIAEPVKPVLDQILPSLPEVPPTGDIPQLPSVHDTIDTLLSEQPGYIPPLGIPSVPFVPSVSVPHNTIPDGSLPGGVAAPTNPDLPGQNVGNTPPTTYYPDQPAIAIPATPVSRPVAPAYPSVQEPVEPAQDTSNQIPAASEPLSPGEWLLNTPSNNSTSSVVLRTILLLTPHLSNNSGLSNAVVELDDEASSPPTMVAHLLTRPLSIISLATSPSPTSGGSGPPVALVPLLAVLTLAVWRVVCRRLDETRPPSVFLSIPTPPG